MIRSIRLADAEGICAIYNYYILNSIATFEKQPLTVEEMQERIKSIHERYPWIVYEEAGEILGYAYANQWRERVAYKQTVESTVYLLPGKQKKGIGSKLYQALIEILETEGFHAIIGGISIPNPDSIALHEKLGFEKIAHFKEVGYKFEQWIDVGYWELLNNNAIPAQTK